MSAMASPNIVDLDEALGINGDEPVHMKKIKLLGRNWTIICDLNAFAMTQIAAGESGGISNFLVNLVVEDEREDFATALSTASNMSGERLGLLLQKLIEVAGERPTEEPSRSPRTAKKQTSSMKSAAH